METTTQEKQFDGVYGKYTITSLDKIEVKRYRFAVLFCAISFCGCLGHWFLIGPSFAWVWLLMMCITLGFALKWIHIYLRPLHKALQILWGIGCIGVSIMLFTFGPKNILTSIYENPIWTISIGPFFAALTGLGFKEFFCFRRFEAIGLTVLLPIALLGHLSQFINEVVVIGMLSISAILLLVLALRKFGMDAAADVGDKSVFEYLDNQSMKEIY
tara:strand:- start:91194 stop:91838 length:645 start_codon:yes stop_codon:yes gene_type:complete